MQAGQYQKDLGRRTGSTVPLQSCSILFWARAVFSSNVQRCHDTCYRSHNCPSLAPQAAEEAGVRIHRLNRRPVLDPRTDPRCNVGNTNIFLYFTESVACWDRTSSVANNIFVYTFKESVYIQIINQIKKNPVYKQQFKFFQNYTFY